MGNKVYDPCEAAEAAVQAARRAIENDADDWRSYAALADALVKRKRYLPDVVVRESVQEAVVAARRAVALAPEEPDAHLALADALLAVIPSRIGTRAAAFAELDRAELLGSDARKVAERRDRSKGLGYYAVYWTCFSAFVIYGLNGDGGAVGRAVAWPAAAVFAVVVVIVRVRSRGQSFREVVRIKRQLTRLRLPTDERVSQSAPVGVAVVAFLDLPTCWMAIPGADGRPAPQWSAWVTAFAIPVVAATAWIGVDRWLRPGTVTRLLRREPYVAVSVSITFFLVIVTTASVLLEVQRPAIWFTLFLAQAAWMTGGFLVGTVTSARRRRTALPLAD